MKVQATLIRTGALVIGMLAALFTARMTGMLLFSGLALLAGLFVFVHVYWLIISLIVYLTDQGAEPAIKQPDPPIEPVRLEQSENGRYLNHRPVFGPHRKVSE